MEVSNVEMLIRKSLRTWEGHLQQLPCSVEDFSKIVAEHHLFYEGHRNMFNCRDDEVVVIPELVTKARSLRHHCVREDGHTELEVRGALCCFSKKLALKAE